jgi:hypothetical protein
MTLEAQERLRYYSRYFKFTNASRRCADQTN